MPAPIQIKRPDVTGDIRALTELTGVSITDVIDEKVRVNKDLLSDNPFDLF